jgi:TRAP-type C4-dicarboxylate transport system permease small subunit
MPGAASLVLALLRPLSATITVLLSVARWAALILLGVMVCVILAQVVFRYVLGDALNWTEEAARFGMLWMTGLMAPVAYRRGGFVAIDMAERALPPRLGASLFLVLAVISLGVLLYALPLSAAHVKSGCLFRSATLWLPFTLEFAFPVWPGQALSFCARASPSLNFEWGMAKMPLAVMYASLFVGLHLLVLVNLELILRTLARILGAGERLPVLPQADAPVAE